MKKKTTKPEMSCKNCYTDCTPSKKSHGMCCDWSSKSEKLIVDFSELKELLSRWNNPKKSFQANEQFYLICFPHFVSISARDLSDKEIKQIKKIKTTMSSGEYAGYSPDEHNKYRQIVDIVGDRIIQPIEI